jgi:DNA-binding winged helix-turn-helix (wHTH) protein
VSCPEGFVKIGRNSMASREVFHFDEFALDVGERRLLRGTETVRLSPKAYDVLVVLVRQSGRLVTKDELLAHVWPESFVEEGILNVHVAALRRALGDDTRPPAYIETVVRSGYRFIAAVRFDSADEKPLTPSAITRPVELYELVGRGPSHLLSGSYFELPAAVGAFRSAIEIDPTYAPAHAGFWRAHGASKRRFARRRTRKRLQRRKLLPCAHWRWTAARRTRRLPLAPSFFSASGTGRRRSAACNVHSKSIRITPRRSCSMGRSRKRSGGSTMGCVASNRRSRAIRDRPAFWCRSPSLTGISGSTTTRLSGPSERSTSTRSMC